MLLVDLFFILAEHNQKVALSRIELEMLDIHELSKIISLDTADLPA
jgi:hypothetical protein